MSCCAPGGSWYGNCGSAKVQHMWHEGIQACKAREPKTAMRQQQNVVQQNLIRTTLDTSVSNAALPAHGLAHASKPYTSTLGAIPAKVIATTTTSILYTPINISLQLSVISPTIDSTSKYIHSQANGRSTTLAFMTETYTASSSFHASSSALVTCRECENLLNIVVRIGIIVIIFLF